MGGQGVEYMRVPPSGVQGFKELLGPEKAFSQKRLESKPSGKKCCIPIVEYPMI